MKLSSFLENSLWCPFWVVCVKVDRSWTSRICLFFFYQTKKFISSHIGWVLDPSRSVFRGGALEHVPPPLGRQPQSTLSTAEGAIHEGVDNQSSVTAPSLGFSGRDAISPCGRPSVFLAPCIHVGVLISHSMRPQLICRKYRRPETSPEGALMHFGH